MATIDLNHLRAFVGVARDLSFSAAARKLDVPTSTVSRAVTSLEELLGVQLFNRSTRHVSLRREPDAFVREGEATPGKGDRVPRLPRRLVRAADGAIGTRHPVRLALVASRLVCLSTTRR